MKSRWQRSGCGSGTAAVGRLEEENGNVKSKVYVLLGMLTLGVAICVSSMTRAQQPAAGGGTLNTRIALINLAQVFKNYDKVKAFSAENRKMLEPYSEKAKGIQQQIEAHTKELEKKDLPEAKRFEYEKNLKSWQRQMEDVSNDAKMIYAKKNEEQMLIVYKEVMDMAQRYAVAHGFELVMHFNDVPIESASEYYNPMNVSRKIQAGACIPMYIAPGMEITKQVYEALNTRYGPTTAAPAVH
jgi:Skp family chaperone for outer membrane proteins